MLALEYSSIYYVQDLNDRAKDKENLLLVLFVVSICAITAISLAIIPMVFSVNRIKFTVLSLFFDIPDVSVNELADKCEDFLIKVSKDEEEDEILS